jgi:hypothetical protein
MPLCHFYKKWRQKRKKVASKKEKSGVKKGKKWRQKRKKVASKKEKSGVKTIFYTFLVVLTNVLTHVLKHILTHVLTPLFLKVAKVAKVALTFFYVF